VFKSTKSSRTCRCLRKMWLDQSGDKTLLRWTKICDESTSRWTKLCRLAQNKSHLRIDDIEEVRYDPQFNDGGYSLCLKVSGSATATGTRKDGRRMKDMYLKMDNCKDLYTWIRIFEHLQVKSVRLKADEFLR